MPSAVTTTAGGTKQSTSGQAPQQSVGVTPFVRASQLHRESAGIDVSRQISAADQDLGAFPINAYGFLRSLTLLVTTSGGAASVAPTATTDGPFNALKNIFLAEPNGAIIAQFNFGYDLFLADKYGGYRYANDPRANSLVFSYVLGATPSFSFLLRIPLEISPRDALGSLPNQNAAAAFVLRMTLSALTLTYTGGTWTTNPTVRIRVFAEEWDQPELSSDGAPNQTTPPALNTTQFWSVQQYPVNAANMNVRLTRMGNYLRNLIFTYRDGSGNRTITQTGANWPQPATFYWDTRPLDVAEQNNWITQVWERYGYSGSLGATIPALDSPGGMDTGVMPYDFASEFKGQVGFENRDLWLPTLGSTRFEIGGQWGVTGTLYVLTNDVAISDNVWY